MVWRKILKGVSLSFREEPGFIVASKLATSGMTESSLSLGSKDYP